MNSRLETLQRQRELLREHVQWLEEEIASERARLAAPAGVQSSQSAPTPDLAEPVRALAPQATAPPTAIAPEPDIKGLHDEVRRGCLLYFFIALAAVGALVGVIYWRYSGN